MRVGEEVFEIVIALFNRTIGLNAVGFAGFVFESHQAIDEVPAQPDARAPDLEIAAEDARQHEDSRLLVYRLAAARGACGGTNAGGRFA